jgi:ribosomal protein L7Ae-like RNA K-turn-binding protein
MELKKLIEKLAKEFEKYKIDYMIIGGQAVLGILM